MSSDDSTTIKPVAGMMHIAPFAFQRATASTLLTESVPQVVDTTTVGHAPLANTRVGNLFHDRDPNLLWYLPAFELAPDVDGSFSFAATQVGVDATGNPFNQVVLSIGLRRVMPPDAVTQLHTVTGVSGGVALREIPLIGLAATLTIVSNDATTGEPKPTTYPGTISGPSADSLTLTFNTILGVAVIIAYENLLNGTATIALSASYQVMRPALFHFVPIHRIPIEIERPEISTVAPVRMAMTRDMPMIAPRPIIGIGPHPIGIGPHPIGPHPIDDGGDPPTPAPPPAPTFIYLTQPLAASLAVAKKYAGTAYSLKYTVTSSGITKTIATVDDLKSFNVRQSEFTELTALGDVSLKYPSFVRLYIGAISRVVVAVPARYGIVRGAGGTAAVCRAVVDPSAGSGACKFEFSFTIGPVISSIELVQLSKDVVANPASHDCTVVLPKQIDPGSSTVATAFRRTATFSPGDRANCFSVVVEVADDGGPAAAVANVNQIIMQLISSVQSLTGTIGIKLDDFYEKLVATGIVLSFAQTSGSDEIAFSIDATSGAIQLANTSPLDLQVSRYATVTGDTIAVQPFAQAILAKQSAQLGSSAPGTAPAILVDRTLALENPLTKAATQRYLTLDVSDVQAVQYQLGVLASGIDFAARGIAQIAVAVTLNDLPQVAVPGFSLSPLDTSGSVQLTLPIMSALTALKATVAFTVTWTATGTAPTQFTLVNDFIDTPVMVLQSSNLPAH